MEDNLTYMFNIVRKKNAELILKSPSKKDLIYSLIDVTNNKICTLKKKIKKNENTNSVLSEILSSSLLIGFLLDGKNIINQTDEFVCSISIKKQIKYTQRKIDEFFKWKSIYNYVQFLEAILGLLYMLDYDFFNFEENTLKICL